MQICWIDGEGHDSHDLSKFLPFEIDILSSALLYKVVRYVYSTLLDTNYSSIFSSKLKFVTLF